uniref:Uncharacterized protein n=1 Tax=Cannabis sativa TaxID=3483 RepID=A0A803P4T3_CANSA
MSVCPPSLSLRPAFRCPRFLARDRRPRLMDVSVEVLKPKASRGSGAQELVCPHRSEPQWMAECGLFSSEDGFVSVPLVSVFWACLRVTSFA